MATSHSMDKPRLVGTGISGLDEVLAGGLAPSRIYLVEGEPGAGKTTLALQFLMEGVRVGDKCHYATLSESKDELLAAATSHGWSLEGIHVREYIVPDKELASESQVTMFHPSEVELSETIQRLIADIDQLQPARFVLDSLSELRLLAQGPLRYRRQILAMRKFFMDRHCTVLLLDDSTGERDAQVRSIAHGVIDLQQLTPGYGAERRRLRVTKMRAQPYRGGYHDFVIRTGGLQVFHRLVAAEHFGKFEREPIASDVAALDQLLGGGPQRGTSTLLIGPPGSGKTTVALQYLFAAAQRGEHGVIFAFDETIGLLVDRTRYLGLDFRPLIDKKRVQIRQIDPAELSPGEFAHAVRAAVERDHAKIVVIDSFNGYLHAMPDEGFLSAQLHELLTYLAQSGVVTLMIVAQRGVVGVQMISPVDASYLADSIVLFRYFESGGKLRKAISVVKKRIGSHEEAIRELRFEQGGIRLCEPLANFHGVLTGVPTVENSATDPASQMDNTTRS